MLLDLFFMAYYNVFGDNMNYDFIVTKIERVALIGKQEYPDSKISFDPCMKCNELIFRFSGEETVLFGQEVLKGKKNAIRFLPKGTASKYEVFHEPGDCILIDFQSDKIVSEKAFAFDIPNGEYIGQLFQKIFSCWAVKKEGYYYESLSLLYKILALMQRTHFALTPHQKIIKPAIDYMYEHFLDENLTVSNLASLCKISESYFKRLFKELYNTSPKQYIIRLKIEKACHLLQLNEYSIAEVAELCNYSSIHFFCRQFKEAMGITPSDFKKKYKSSK